MAKRKAGLEAILIPDTDKSPAIFADTNEALRQHVINSPLARIGFAAVMAALGWSLIVE